MTPRTFRYRVTPLQAVILLYHVMISEDAENDADRTVEEIAADIDTFNSYLSKGVLESALYCCNLEDEKGKFWHPWKWPFDKFVRDLIPKDQKFNKYYNVLCEDKDDGPNDKTGR